jgi:hypothetical protein
MNKNADWISAPLTAGRFAFLLGLGIFAAYPDVVLGSRAFFFRDFGIFAYPLAHYHRESFWRGEVPLWNPLNNCGIPFLAQWNTLVVYPGSLFYLVFPLSWALSVFCLAHLWVGGVGMYLLARAWTKNRLAAAAAGLIYSFNGMSLNALMWPAVSAAVAWMPWVVLTAELGWARGGRRVITASVLGAMQMLSGAPEVIVLTWLFIGALAVTRLLEDPQRAGVLARRLAVMILLVAGLSGLQLLPFFELLSHSQRQASEESVYWSLSGTGLANFLVPLFRCFRTSHQVYLQADQQWTSSYYLGISGTALALVSVCHIRTRRVNLLASISVLMLVLAMGHNGYLYPWLLRALPPLGLMRYPIKMMFLVSFSVPLLAAFAVLQFQAEDLERRRTCWRSLSVIAVNFLLAGAAIVWFDHMFPAGSSYRAAWTDLWENALARLVFFAVALTTFYAGNVARKPAMRHLLFLAFLVLLSADLLTHVPRQNPTVPRAAYEPGLVRLSPAPAHGLSRAMVSPEAQLKFKTAAVSEGLKHYVGHRLGLFSNCNLLDGIPKVNGFYALSLREPNDVRSLLYGNDAERSPGLLDFLNVSHVTAPGALFDWVVRTNYLPFVTAGQRPVFADDATTLRSLTAGDFNPREAVYLPLGAATRVTAGAASARILSSRLTAHGGEIELEAKDRSLVVLSQAYYPAWRAFLDGQTVTVWRANYAFQAVETPAGRHRLELVYRDWFFAFGIGVSAVTLLMCLVGLRISARDSVRGRLFCQRFLPLTGDRHAAESTTTL